MWHFWHRSQHMKAGALLEGNTKIRQILSEWKHCTIAWRQPRQMWTKLDSDYKYSLIKFTTFSLWLLWEILRNITLYWEIGRRWKPDNVILWAWSQKGFIGSVHQNMSSSLSPLEKNFTNSEKGKNHIVKIWCSNAHHKSQIMMSCEHS